MLRRDRDERQDANRGGRSQSALRTDGCDQLNAARLEVSQSRRAQREDAEVDDDMSG